MAVRTFIALELSAPLKESILALIETLRARGVRASWGRRSTLHLTLKFLGDIDEEHLEDVIEAVGRGAQRVRPFEFETERLGAFPSPRRPRVLWVGVRPVDELFDLHEALEGELAAIGHPRERRKFSPHITLGRVRDPRSEGIEDALRELEAPIGRVSVAEVLVMKSTLQPNGAVHEVVSAVPLVEDDET